MALHAVWVPGSVTIPPNSYVLNYVNVGGANIHYSEIIGVRGTSARYRLRGEQSGAFHIPIPTPVIVNDVRARLARIFVLMNLEKQSVAGPPNRVARLERIQVYDGPNTTPIFSAEPRNHLGTSYIEGDLSRSIIYETPRTPTTPVNSWPQQNTWPIPNQPQIFFGLTITLVIKAYNADCDVTFVTAGADFNV
jgi:hypothetical protein